MQKAFDLIKERLEELDRKTFRISPKDAIEIVDKVAEEYKDIEITPEQIIEVDKLYREKCEELARVQQSEQRALILPCSFGESFFTVLGGDDDRKVYELVLDIIRANTYDKNKITFVCHVKGKEWDRRYIDSEKETYKTKSEALKVLEK